MNKLFLVIALLLLVAGCTNAVQDSGSNATVIENEDEAIDAMVNVSGGVDDLGSTLEDIDDLLG